LLKKAHYDCLDRKIKVEIQARQIKKGIWVGKNTLIHNQIKCEPPCIIGDNVKIGKNCIIGKYSVIGNNCIIGNNVKIYDSIIWDNVVVKSNVKLNSCIIGNNAVVTENITMFEGTILNIE
jgi:NDP-sugar pyrophosphorylase family protein